MSYSPTFNRPVKGKFQDDTSFVSIIGGSDAYLLEDEINEMQWIQINTRNELINSLYSNGYIKEDNINHVRSSNQTDNTFYVGNFKVNIEGFIGKIFNYKDGDTNDYHSISLPFTTYNRYDFVYLEVYLKILNETTTQVSKYGGLDNVLINYDVLDSRISLPTSKRIQLQWKISIQENINYVPNEAIFDNNDNNIISNLLHGGCVYNNDIDGVYTITSTSDLDNNIVDKLAFAMPLFVVKRYANKNIIENQDIIDVRPESVNKNSSNDKDIIDILARLNTLEQRMNNISTEVLSDQKAYSLSMNKKTGIFTGHTDIVDGTTVTIDNYSVANNNYVVALTNLGNQYGGQIGEVWCWQDGNKYHVCNSGDKNVLFNAFDFRNDNDEIKYGYITSTGNGLAGISKAIDYVDLGITWNLDECLIYILPMYENSISTVPSIGDIFIEYDDSQISVYNTGDAGIRLQWFILHVNNPNLELRTLQLNDSTIVNDAFGKHHVKIFSDTSWGNHNILLGTPIINNTDTINLGEIYVEQNKDSFMLTTTSYGNATIKFVVFKTAYTNGV